ncbi:MAG TPA: MFS transporter, partial [Gemmatimonadales bacterium]|nr:MFS transporter [Gemmatimonadales bacterium]
MAWIFTLFLLFDLIGTPLLATLSDLRGRRAIYVLSVGLFAAGSLVVALAPSFSVLLIGRALQGFGAGGIFPVASAVIGDLFPVERRGRALGLIGAVFGIAFLVGPVLGGVLLHFGWRWLFLVNLPIAALVVAGALRLLPSTRAEQARSIDFVGLGLLMLAVFALAFGLNGLDAAEIGTSLASLRVWPFLVGGALLAPAFWRWESRQEHPLLRPDFLRQRQVRIASALAVGAGLTEASVVFAPALLVVVWLGGHYTAAACVVLAALASWEFMTLALGAERYATTIGVVLGLWVACATLGYFLVLTPLVIIAALLAVLIRPDPVSTSLSRAAIV